MGVEDLVLREDDRVCGVVLNWMAVVKELIPSDVIARYVGGNTIGGN
ncbi:MAG: hypothetical protein H5T97_09925, partial [Firmicutes bacterium]|nr:hypothetical protein [Bacillota bacterium]